MIKSIFNNHCHWQLPWGGLIITEQAWSSVGCHLWVFTDVSLVSAQECSIYWSIINFWLPFWCLVSLWRELDLFIFTHCRLDRTWSLSPERVRTEENINDETSFHDMGLENQPYEVYEWCWPEVAGTLSSWRGIQPKRSDFLGYTWSGPAPQVNLVSIGIFENQSRRHCRLGIFSHFNWGWQILHIRSKSKWYSDDETSLSNSKSQLNWKGGIPQHSRSETVWVLAVAADGTISPKEEN